MKLIRPSIVAPSDEFEQEKAEAAEVHARIDSVDGRSNHDHRGWPVEREHDMPQGGTQFTVEQSAAFVECFVVEPSGSGPLAGRTFAVKDIIDIAARRTACGNPTWRETHAPAASHAWTYRRADAAPLAKFR